VVSILLETAKSYLFGYLMNIIIATLNDVSEVH